MIKLNATDIRISPIYMKTKKSNTKKPKCEPSEVLNKLYQIAGVDTYQAQKYAFVIKHKERGGRTVMGQLPQNYIKTTEVYVPIPRLSKDSEPQGEYKVIQKLLPHYFIDKLWSKGKGSGTRTIQEVVKESLKDPTTQGRVMLNACCIDTKTAPGGFYYKLGFRFKNSGANKQAEKWIQEGGRKENAPFLVGEMYLPKENISHCLNYKVKPTTKNN